MILHICHLLNLGGRVCAGNFTIRVPGVLLPACVCSEALGASISEDVAKRLLLLCLKSTAVKEVWQVCQAGWSTNLLIGDNLESQLLC